MIRLSDKLLTFDELKAMNDDAISKGFWRFDRRLFLPGMGWYNDLYLDIDIRQDFLSRHYWRDWANKRPPIELVCPDGNIWCPDRKSSNGDGWIVTGEWPNITCSPSIDCEPMKTHMPDGKYYHGFLRNGEFTDDLSGHVFSIPNVDDNYGKR